MPIKKQLKFHGKILPELCYSDIFHYLVDTCSSYTMENMKTFKSLEFYKLLDGFTECRHALFVIVEFNWHILQKFVYNLNDVSFECNCQFHLSVSVALYCP